MLAFRDGHMIGGAGHEIYVRNLNAPLNPRFTRHARRRADRRSRDATTWSATRASTSRPPVVNSPGESSKAVLTEGARETLEGDRLISQEGEDAAELHAAAPTTNVNGRIIAVVDDATQIGQYQVVVINRGSATASRRAT